MPFFSPCFEQFAQGVPNSGRLNPIADKDVKVFHGFLN